jgi:hypothetical protein
MMPMPAVIIVKVQKPIVGTDVLIYDRLRKIYYMTPMTPGLEVLLGDSLKVYARAKKSAAGLVIGNKVADQDW